MRLVDAFEFFYAGKLITSLTSSLLDVFLSRCGLSFEPTFYLEFSMGVSLAVECFFDCLLLLRYGSSMLFINDLNINIESKY